MESWLQRLFLSAALLLSLPSLAEENTKVGNDSATLDAVIKPDLERRKIDESKIDSENFEIGISSGVMSTEDFGNNSSLSAFLAYYVSEDWFLEATYGSSQTSKSSAEWLGGIDLLTEDERELTYLDFSLGLNILPGEIYLGSNHPFNVVHLTV